MTASQHLSDDNWWILLRRQSPIGCAAATGLRSDGSKFARITAATTDGCSPFISPGQMLSAHWPGHKARAKRRRKFPTLWPLSIVTSRPQLENASMDCPPKPTFWSFCTLYCGWGLWKQISREPSLCFTGLAFLQESRDRIPQHGCQPRLPN